MSQKAPEDKVQDIQSFHSEIRKLAAVSEGDEQHIVGRFKLCQIATWTRHLSHFPSQVVIHTQIRGTKLYGSVEELQVWTSVSALFR